MLASFLRFSAHMKSIIVELNINVYFNCNYRQERRKAFDIYKGWGNEKAHVGKQRGVFSDVNGPPAVII